MRILYISLLTLVLLAGGYVWWWFQVADNMELLADNWRQQRLAEGYEIAHDPLVISGFPYRVKIDAENLSVANPTHFQQPTLEITSFWAVVQPWQINHVIFGIDGATRIIWQDKGEAKSVDLAAASSLGSATFNRQGRLQTVAVDIEALQAAPSWRPPVTAKRVQIHGRPSPLAQGEDEDAPRDQQIALHISQMIIDGMEDFPLGKRIEEFALSSQLHGTIKKLPSRATLTDWRDKGGFLDITSLKVTWGHGEMEGSGRLSLDNSYFPAGKFDSRISGYVDILQALVSTGKINQNTAKTVSFGLDMLAKEKSDGRKYIALPIVAEDGGLYLGPIFLMRLSPLFKEK
ncbi:MAG: DUF2125 domain-containing protein [Amylibacter sp.]|nr:DUF2125 domain-containing protein [Amylibacter sp.]